MDLETQRVVNDGQALEDFTKSNGWHLVKQKFTDKLMDLQSVMNIQGTTPDEIATELYARKLAVTYLADLIKDIEGTVQQHNNNKTMVSDAIIVEF